MIQNYSKQGSVGRFGIHYEDPGLVGCNAMQFNISFPVFRKERQNKLIIYPENGGNKFSRNYVPNYKSRVTEDDNLECTGNPLGRAQPCTFRNDHFYKSYAECIAHNKVGRY